MDTADLAMVSRIRVEVRGGSMEAAEQAAFAVLDHARGAAFLEGFAPDMGSYSDHHFNRPTVMFKPGDEPEAWTELGLHYYGRLAFTFEPQVARGGLKLYGYKVVQDESQLPEDMRSARDGEDVTDEVIVLLRRNPVTREHSWEGTPDYEAALAKEIAERDGVEASAEEILDNIRRLVNVDHVEVQSPRRGQGWIVMVDLNDKPESLRVQGDSLRAAALDAYGKCGQQVTHYDTSASS